MEDIIEKEKEPQRVLLGTKPMDFNTLKEGTHLFAAEFNHVKTENGFNDFWTVHEYVFEKRIMDSDMAILYNPKVDKKFKLSLKSGFALSKEDAVKIVIDSHEKILNLMKAAKCE